MEQMPNIGDRDFVTALARGLEVLQVCAAHVKGISLSDAAALTGLSRATVRRSLLTLAATGPLPADVALVEAWQADRWGNCTYRKSGRNFNPVMASAAALTVVQAHHIVPLGALDPESIVTPGIFVNRVVSVPAGDPEG